MVDDDDEAELEGVVWICLHTLDGHCAVVGAFTTEEKALEAVPDQHDGQYWICPTDLDTIVGGETDRFNDMVDRIYPVFMIEFIPELELPVEKPKKVDKKHLTVIK